MSENENTQTQPDENQTQGQSQPDENQPNAVQPAEPWTHDGRPQQFPVEPQSPQDAPAPQSQ